MQYLSQHVLLVTLPRQPQLANDLEIAMRMSRPQSTRDVIVDFSLVGIMPSGTLSELMNLERQLSNAGRQLILCAVPGNIRRIFTQVGLGGLFQFAQDQFVALHSFDSSRCSYN